MRFPLSRREMLASSANGFGMSTIAGLCSEAAAATNPAAPVTPRFAARAKRVIFLCMRGGPSHMESFDHKPKLNADNGKPTGKKGLNYFGSQWKFSQHGESGIPVSSLFPHTSKVVDDLCILNGMHTDNPKHGAALTQLHTGSFLFERPSIGPGFCTVWERRTAICRDS